MIALNKFPENNAEKTISEFVDCWQHKNWNKIAKYCQKTWLKNNPDYKIWFEAYFGIRKIVDAKIISKIVHSEIFVEYFVELNSIIQNESRKEIVQVNMIKEESPYKPSTLGEWGINPISCMRINLSRN